MNCLFVMYACALGDPPARQAMAAFRREGYRVHLIQLGSGQANGAGNAPVDAVHTVALPAWLGSSKALHNWLRWRAFTRRVANLIAEVKPELVVTVMLHALAALPWKLAHRNSCKLLSCIYDIPALEFSGKLDRPIIAAGWRRLAEADVVWASDIHKARLAREIGKLSALPVVCHNCPTLDYLPEPTWPRDGWFRSELRKAGATIGENGGSILLRAGAVGECGGIEETLQAMRDLPDNYLFVMMGRPSEFYKQCLVGEIEKLGLRRRAFFWDHASDDIWKKALQGADIGHLIQGPFPPGRMERLYELNSSLSNNRLFQYMAAGLPILAYDDPRMADLYREIPCFSIVRVSHLKIDIKTLWKGLGENTGFRKQQGMAARKWHESKYNWEYQFAPILNHFLAT